MTLTKGHYDNLKEGLDTTGLSHEDKHMWLGVLDNAQDEQIETFMYFLNSGADMLSEATELMRMKLEQLDDGSINDEIIDFEKDLINSSKQKDLQAKNK